VDFFHRSFEQEAVPSQTVSSSPASTPRFIESGVFTARVMRIYAVEALGSIGANVLMLGIYFYAPHAYGWGVRQNLLLATTLGVVYTLAALCGAKIAGLLGRQRGMLALFTCHVLFLSFAVLINNEAAQIAALIGTTICGAAGWPIVESMVSDGADAKSLSRRIAAYNFTWSSTGALTVALCGLIIEHWPRGMFVLPLIVHIMAWLLIARGGLEPAHAATPNAVPAFVPSAPGGPGAAPIMAAVQHPEPHALGPIDPGLKQMRTLALWLSRLALPATYAVIYSLGAIMPTLPTVRHLAPWQQTLIGSIWMAARFVSFIVLGFTTWWHSRPRMLLAASGGLLIAFLGVVLAPPELLVEMMLAQVALGFTMGMIYAGSLYFGMVLSEGSAEHGGYHEALIGAGSVLGPGSGWLIGLLLPGSSNVTIAAIATVIGISVAAGAVASLRFSNRRASG
jgi:MFS family permease